MKIAITVGTRPEFIKTWSVIKAAKSRSDIKLVLIHTGQHYDYEMSQTFFEDLRIEPPDYNLEVGSHKNIIQMYRIMESISPILQNEHPDILLVQGDTNSGAAAAISAVQLEIPVGHIEAGCRSFDRTMPEEINRIIIDSISNLLFAPSKIAYYNLLREGSDPDRCILVGNTAVDVLKHGLTLIKNRRRPFKYDYAVATIHRAGNVDSTHRLRNILQALSQLPIRCILPIHPRTRKRILEYKLQPYINQEKLHVVNPMNYLEFLNLIRFSKVVITDSGGVQEEAALLKIPTITIRDNTEWPETIWSGFNVLVSATTEDIVGNVSLSLKKNINYDGALYGDGAGEKIIKAIVEAYSSGTLHYTPIPIRLTGYPILRLTDKPTEKVLLRFSENGRMVLRNGRQFIVQSTCELDKMAQKDV